MTAEPMFVASLLASALAAGDGSCLVRGGISRPLKRHTLTCEFTGASCSLGAAAGDSLNRAGRTGGVAALERVRSYAGNSGLNS